MSDACGANSVVDAPKARSGRRPAPLGRGGGSMSDACGANSVQASRDQPGRQQRGATATTVRTNR